MVAAAVDKVGHQVVVVVYGGQKKRGAEQLDLLLLTARVFFLFFYVGRVRRPVGRESDMSLIVDHTRGASNRQIKSTTKKKRRGTIIRRS